MEHNQNPRRNSRCGEYLFMGGFLLLLLLALLTGCGPADSHFHASPGPSPDLEPPVIGGARDVQVRVGDNPFYRRGVTVTDNSGETPQLIIDSTRVDVSTPGRYPVVYTAVDISGNKTSVTVTVTVAEGEE